MKLTYYGHSACLLECRGQRLLFDPFLSGNPNAGISPDAVECDYILLTHGHADHLGDTLAIAQRTGATVIAVFELAGYCQRKGAEAHPMHIGGRCAFPFGSVKLTIAHHSSSFTEVDGSTVYLGNPAGIIVESEGKTLYHAGDTGLFYDMKLIGEHHAIDLALLPIGDNFTMGIGDACRAVEFLKPGRVVPVHYNTFPAIVVDPQAFAHEASAPVAVLEPGQSIEV